MSTDDPFDLQRFVSAQAGVYDQALAELKAGAKRSHWMWFVFPQLKGLGFSPTAQHYGIGSLAEASAYLDHPVLGPRLRDCTAAVKAVVGRTAHEIFGAPDDLKFRSSMTLFQAAAPADPLFAEAIARYFGGAPDPRTLALLQAG
jgi:uncharacterized protein (DUF1810 family)